ncbi:hypothetical protein [Kitasatospora sp. NPDC056181]|uniref:hypothetical protein n=1 Tax=Kitasatospora sp. NPDC056181 TaxID=3345737 RepID=UPI0035DC08A1
MAAGLQLARLLGGLPGAFPRPVGPGRRVRALGLGGLRPFPGQRETVLARASRFSLGQRGVGLLGFTRCPSAGRLGVLQVASASLAACSATATTSRA